MCVCVCLRILCKHQGNSLFQIPWYRMETLWDVASGPEIDNLEVLEVPNTAERMNALMEEGVGREEAFRKASKEYRRVRETNQKVLMPVGKSLKELNRGVKRSTVVSYAAAAGHPIGQQNLGAEAAHQI
ncbi:hypothetical protein KFL_005510070 [Klebsormidium nitens]|uniref:Uncharacterized protein n=1 Tax=Klebsormidium nitens TaxID=105231 RepID=A0A1Y1IHY5_KLENI|nr:hypothetical protein KFL_005510070 [Klebsormidium nitens]|eukprot:GAQ89692.1 hypothetical protein KFL_005510070 [Klebsormidium nitens]